MRCLKTRTLLALLTAAWLLGVVYFLGDLKQSGESTHDNGDPLAEYDRFLDQNIDGQDRGRSRVDDLKVRVCLIGINL